MSKSLAIIDHVGQKAGMDYFTSNLAEALCSTGVEVDVYTNFSSSGKARYIRSFSGNSRSLLHKAFDFFIGNFSSLYSIKQSKVKQVVFHSFETGIKEFMVFLLSSLLGLKPLIIVHDVESFANGDSLLLKKIIFRHLAKKIYCLNRFSKQVLLDNLGQSIVGKVIEIKHGNFLAQKNDNLNKSIARTKLAWDQKAVKVLFFGQIKKVKGLDVLINAFKKVENAELVIAGRVWKDSFANYEQLIEQNNLQDRIDLRIRFISDEERELLFHAADIIVLPYRKIFQSGVLLMAMSYAKAVVASDLDANAEIIENNVTGMLFKEGDDKDLSAVLNSLILDEQKRNTMANAALELMKLKYNWTEVALKVNHSIS